MAEKAAADSRAAPGRSSRRELFAAAASGLAGLAAACASGGGQTTVLDTPEGRVLQWQRDDLLVLVSGLQPTYRDGEQINLRIILNNQSQKRGLYRPRTKLVGRGQQVVAETVVTSVTVPPLDAETIERTLDLGPTVATGDYTLIVELPPWSLEGQTVGGGQLTASVRVE